METPSILLTTEGTYPCHTGGVSVWCDKLIRGLPDAEFHVLAITGAPNLRPAFSIPENVASVQLLPLWGTEEPGAEEPRFSDTYRKKLRTTSAVIRERFLGPFETIVRALLARGAESNELAGAMVQLYGYFGEFDYAHSVRSPEAWSSFLRVCSTWPGAGSGLNLQEATQCMRWLQRYLAVLSVRLPRVDIAHASMSGFAGVPGMLLKALHGTPFLLSEHGVYLRELYISLGQGNYSRNCRAFLLALNESVIRMNYDYADAVTTLCEFNRKWQLQLGANAQKIWKVPNGVEEDLFFPREGERREQPVVLTLSRVMPLKGIDVLLRAALLVRQRVPGVTFRILGEPAQDDYYRRCLQFIADHQLERNIEMGHTKDPASAYRAADVFCLPSISEAMPYSVIEAMLSGCPVVATDVGGISELVADTGLLVKPNAPEALAAGILEMLDGEEGAEKRRRLAMAALVRAKKHYTLRQSTARFRRLYQALGAQLEGLYAIAEMPESGTRERSLVATG